MSTPNEIYRDNVVQGVPSSGVHNPVKSEIRNYLNGLEERVNTTGGVILSSSYNLVGDGVTDDSVAFQEFVDALEAQGLEGRLLPGQYRISNIQVNGGIVLKGTTGVEAFNRTGDPSTQSWIIHDNTTNPAFVFTGVNARGSVLEKIAFYQPHPDVGAGWAPTVYPYVIDIRDTFGGVTMRNLFMQGVYRGISIVNAGRTEIDGLFGQFYQNILKMDRLFDVSSIQNIHHWPFTSTDVNVYAWQQLNHVSYLMGRVDSAVFSGRIFSFSGRFMFQFAPPDTTTPPTVGSATRIKIHSAQADAIGTGIYCSPGVSTTQVEFGILDIQSQDLAIFAGGTGPVQGIAGLPAIWFDDCNDIRINIGSLRTEFNDQNVVRMEDNTFNIRLNTNMVRGSTYNQADGGFAAFDLGNTTNPTVNRMVVGTDLFLEGGVNSPPVTDPTSNGQFVRAFEGSGGTLTTDRLIIPGSTTDYGIRVDTTPSLGGQMLGRSTFVMGGNQVFQFIAEGTGDNVDIQLIPKGTGGIIDADGNPITGGGSGGNVSQLVPSGSTDYVIRVDRLTTDIGGQGLFRSVQISGGNQVNQWIGEGTGADVDLQLIPKGAGRVIDADGNVLGGPVSTLSIGAATGVLAVNGSLTLSNGAFGATYQNDGNINGANAYNNATNGGLGGTGSLTSYIEARIAASGGGGGGGSTLTNSPASLTLGTNGAFTLTNGTVAGVFQNDGNITSANAFNDATNGGLGGDGTLTNYIDTRATRLIGTVDATRLGNSPASAVLSTGGDLTLSDGTTAGVFQNDGNITGASVFNNVTNGGLGGDGSLTNYIEARITAGGGGGSSSSISDGSGTATITNSGALFVSNGTTTAEYQSDGNIVSANAFNNATNGGLGGNGSLINYIDERAARVTNDRIVSGDVTLRIDGSNAVRLENLSESCNIQTDGNITNARIFNNAFNGGLGGNGTLTDYIDARAAAVPNDRIVSGLLSLRTEGTSAVRLINNTASVDFQTDGNITNASAYNSSSNGGLGGDGSITSYIEARAAAFSDRRLKKNIKEYDKGLEVVTQLFGYSFEYTEDSNLPEGVHHYVIAQELESIAPELVTKGVEDRLLVDAKGLITVLLNSVKELANRVEALENEQVNT